MWLTYGLEPLTDVAFAGHERLTTAPTDARFDLVIVWHVLEHLPRPVDTLRTHIVAHRGLPARADGIVRPRDGHRAHSGTAWEGSSGWRSVWARPRSVGGVVGRMTALG